MNVLVGTKQFKMLLEEEFVDRLKSVANKAGRDSAQHLAEEILTIYLPVYVAVHDATRRAVTYQSTFESVREPERKLAPVVATIGSPKAEAAAEMTRDDILRTIAPDEIAEAKQRTTPRRTQRLGVLKEKAK